MRFSRCSGILLHPTLHLSQVVTALEVSIVKHSFEWVDFLEQTSQSLWQVLPLGPTGYGDSPYQIFSTFAGNPYLISLEDLVQDGLLDEVSLSQMPETHPDRGGPWHNLSPETSTFGSCCIGVSAASQT